MTDSRFPDPPSRLNQAAFPPSVQDGQQVRVERVSGNLHDVRRPVRLEGEVVQLNKDGTVTIRTEEGDVDVRLRGNAAPPVEGQRIEIDIPAGRPPRQAVIRPAAPEEGAVVIKSSNIQSSIPLTSSPPTATPPPPAVPIAVVNATQEKPVQEAAPVLPTPAPLTEDAIVRLVPLPPTVQVIVPPPVSVPMPVVPASPEIVTSAPVVVPQVVAVSPVTPNAPVQTGQVSPSVPDVVTIAGSEQKTSAPVLPPVIDPLRTNLSTAPAPVENVLVPNVSPESPVLPTVSTVDQVAPSETSIGTIVKALVAQVSNTLATLSSKPIFVSSQSIPPPDLPPLEGGRIQVVENVNVTPETVLNKEATLPLPVTSLLPPVTSTLSPLPPIIQKILQAPVVKNVVETVTAFVSSTPSAAPRIVPPLTSEAPIVLANIQQVSDGLIPAVAPPIISPLPPVISPPSPFSLIPSVPFDVQIAAVTFPDAPPIAPQALVPDGTVQNVVLPLVIPSEMPIEGQRFTVPIASSETNLTPKNDPAAIASIPVPTPQITPIQLQVEGLSPKGLPIVSMALPNVPRPSLFELQFNAYPLPVGTQIEAVPLPQQVQNVSTPIQAAALPLTLIPQTPWVEFDDFLVTIQQIAPQAAQAFIQSLPNAAAPQKIPAAALFFIAVMRTGDLGMIFGEKTVDALRRAGKGEFIAKMARDVGGDAAPIQQSQDWRSMPLPLYAQGDIHKMMLHIKRQDDQGGGENQKGERGTRFLFDLDLSQMGAVQVDGFFRAGRLDLIVRSQTDFSPSMRETMRDLYAEALRETKIAGDLSFQSRPDQWVSVATARRQFGVSI